MAKIGMPGSTQPGPALWLSVLLTMIGLTLASVGGWQSFQQAFELLASESFDTPGGQTRDLAPGQYHTYGVIAEMSVFDLDPNVLDEPAFGAEQITVRNVDTGMAVDVTVASSNLTLGRSSNVYELVAEFTVSESGRYEVTIDSAEQSRAVFGRSIESAPDRVIPWVIMLGVGALVSIIGVVMLITGIVRRSKVKNQPGYFSAGQPPTGYPPSAGSPTYGAPPSQDQGANKPESNTPWD